MIKKYFIKIWRIFALALALTIYFILNLIAHGQTLNQPLAPVRKVINEYFGRKIIDPYRWMEEPKSTELADWIKGQNDFTGNYPDKLPLREKFLKQLEAQNNSIVSVSSVSGINRVGNPYFYLKLTPGECDCRYRRPAKNQHFYGSIMMQDTASAIQTN